MDRPQVNIDCIENFFTFHNFWETCTRPEKTELPWNFSLYWIYFLHSGLLTTCACPENSFPWNFLLYWIYFLPFRIFEQLCACPEKQSCPRSFHCIEYTFYIQEFWATCIHMPWKTEGALNSQYWLYIFYHSGFLSNLRFHWKTELPWNFSLYLNMYFLSFRIFEQLAVALKTEFALKFFKPGGRPTPRLVRLWGGIYPTQKEMW